MPSYIQIESPTRSDTEGASTSRGAASGASATTSCPGMTRPGKHPVVKFPQHPAISSSSRSRLTNELDRSNWQDLASNLGLQHWVPMLQGRGSPTEILLNICDTNRMTASDLKNRLESIDRADLVHLVKMPREDPDVDSMSFPSRPVPVLEDTPDYIEVQGSETYEKHY